MSSLKILITGGSGLLGQYLNIELASKYEILTLYHFTAGNSSNYSSRQVDIKEEKSVEDIFKEFQPQIVIHTAAISNQEKATRFGDKLIYDTNVRATETIARLCLKYDAKLIYTSTDLVYAGYRGTMLKEDAKIAPISLYAETKLMGEIKIKNTFDNYIILRTSLLYGFGLSHRLCHFDKIFVDLKNKRRVRLFKDQVRTPLSLKEAARIIRFLCELDLRGETINLGGVEKISRVQLGRMLCEIGGFDPKLIVPISMKDVRNFPAVYDVSLNTEKLNLLGVQRLNVTDSIKEILRI
jgi:dTDP-4-dehydrorhamnose reductase